MRHVAVLLAGLLSLHATQVGAQHQDDKPALDDLCATPASWAPPFTHIYRLRNGGTLIFVAVDHVRDPASSTMAQIKTAFDRYKPGVVLVEAVSSAKSTDSNYLKFLADTASRQSAAGHIQENLYAVKLAVDAKVAYLGWDLSPHDEYVADIANGFDISDAIGAHLSRAHLNPFATPSPSLIQSEISSVPHVRQPDSFDYAGWYRKTYGGVFDPTTGSPCGKGVASVIVKFESIRRTLNLANMLDTYAKPNAVVMVEAGANHWLALRHYLESISTSVS